MITLRLHVTRAWLIVSPIKQDTHINSLYGLCVDLNPIRSGIADTLETSDHTSVKARIKCAQPTERPHQPRHMLPFAGNPRQDMPDGLPYELNDYLALVDWTGKISRDDKRGVIDLNLPPILQQNVYQAPTGSE
ncbi:hypothetical protein [Alkalimarinus coralli]|uniref:hypothetical protein n=1 Tax=Alkalimarinus coralli TaxID=2935863 RepID=UPI00202B369F|nr:hypothetical protein [Alkalimarinus coralli]